MEKKPLTPEEKRKKALKVSCGVRIAGKLCYAQKKRPWKAKIWILSGKYRHKRACPWCAWKLRRLTQ